MKLTPYPFKINKSLEITSIALVILSFVASIYFYQHMPAQVITHWDINGAPNGYSSRVFGAFGIPVIICIAYLLLFILPTIDPQKKRYADFGKAYQVIKVAILSVLAITYVMASLVNIGYTIQIQVVIPIVVGLLFIVIGNYLGDIKKNYFVGVRTPWTLSSEIIWNKTNTLAGTLFMLAGVAVIISAFLNPTLSFVVLIVAILASALIPILYSYVLWKKGL